MKNKKQMNYLFNDSVNEAKTDLATDLLCDKREKNTVRVYVEGNTDVCVYEYLLDKKCDIKVIPQEKGKSYVYEFIAQLADQKKKEKESNRRIHNLDGIIAIVDEDLDGLRGIEINEELSIFSTGDHDIECLLLHSNALNIYIQRIIPYDSESPSKKGKAKEIYRKIEKDFENLGRTLGFMRWSLQVGKIKGKIKDWNKNKFIFYDSNLGTFQIDEEKMVRHVVDICDDIRPTQENQLLEQFRSLKKSKGDISVWKVAQGHDLINILINVLSVYLCKYDSNRYRHLHKMRITLKNNISVPNNEWLDNRLINSEIEIVEDLASIYGNGCFQKTSLYKNLSDWEKKENYKYRVLRKAVYDDLAMENQY